MLMMYMGGFISMILHGKVHWSSPAKLEAYSLDYYLAISNCQ